MPVVEQRVIDDEHQVGRNDPCWCGIREEVQEVSWCVASDDHRIH